MTSSRIFLVMFLSMSAPAFAENVTRQFSHLVGGPDGYLVTFVDVVGCTSNPACHERGTTRSLRLDGQARITSELTLGPGDPGWGLEAVGAGALGWLVSVGSRQWIVGATDVVTPASGFETSYDLSSWLDVGDGWLEGAGGSITHRGLDGTPGSSHPVIAPSSTLQIGPSLGVRSDGQVLAAWGDDTGFSVMRVARDGAALEAPTKIQVVSSLTGYVSYPDEATRVTGTSTGWLVYTSLDDREWLTSVPLVGAPVTTALAARTNVGAQFRFAVPSTRGVQWVELASSTGDTYGTDELSITQLGPDGQPLALPSTTVSDIPAYGVSFASARVGDGFALVKPSDGTDRGVTIVGVTDDGVPRAPQSSFAPPVGCSASGRPSGDLAGILVAMACAGRALGRTRRRPASA